MRFFRRVKVYERFHKTDRIKNGFKKNLNVVNTKEK